jgi:uncharacterized protein YkwD
MSFNWIDALLVLIILLNIALGWQRGFILSLLDLVRWISSWLAGLFFYKPVSGLLASATDLTETWRDPVAFLIVFFLASALIQYLGYKLLQRVPKDVHKRRINRALGTLPGTVSGLIMAAIVSALLFAMPFSDGLSRSVQESALADRFAMYTNEAEVALGGIFEPAIRQTLNRLITTQPGSTESVELPFKIENTRPLPDLEAQMLDLVNQERTSRGLQPLTADPELTEVARRHSADMFARGYFSHHTPEGKDPFERIRDGGVTFRTAGENLALAPTLSIAHNGLMNSPGHRENILRPQFGRLGIGITDGGRRGLMVTQNFRN